MSSQDSSLKHSAVTADMTATSVDVEPLIARARRLLDLRRDAEALEYFAQVRGLAPAMPGAILGQCWALLRLGRAEDALAIIDQAMREQPTLPGADGMRAHIFLALGRSHESWTAANRGCSAIPTDALALLARGLVLRERGDAGAALAAFDAALSADPTLAAAHQGRGSALASLGRPEAAIEALDCARRLDPNNPAIPIRRGQLMIQLHRFDQAVDAFAAALAIDPRHTAALQGHAQCLAALGRAAEAVEAYGRLLAAAPNADYMRGERFHVQLQCCDWRDFEQQREDIAARVRRGERADNPGTFMSHSDSAADQWCCARTFAADFCATPIGQFASNQQRETSRIRVAYLSADFHTHATALLAAGLFEAHDRSRFEIFGLSFGPDDGGEMRRRLTHAFEHFEDVRHLTDRQIAELIQSRGIDIAVDLKGYTLGARPQIFTYRPAPVQVSFLGYPGTLGGDFMDYIVADRTVIPESQRGFYSEQVIYMPECYQVNDAWRDPGVAAARHAAGLPEDAFVFCCFNNAYKISPSVFDDWMGILRAVPGSILWLLEGTAAAMANLRTVATGSGVHADRLVFAPWQSAADHLARCALADLFLDTRPYTAHTTASDALRSGVPLITQPGGTFASRVATSLLRAIGVDSLSVGSREAYVSLAIRLAQSPSELKGLKQKLALTRQSSPLFDPVRYCRHLETAFEIICARARRGEAPGPLVVPA
jgi:predicted O-linked N-acetylglucosamine transferase (SPINDLY family)